MGLLQKKTAADSVTLNPQQDVHITMLDWVRNNSVAQCTAGYRRYVCPRYRDVLCIRLQSTFLISIKMWHSQQSSSSL